jgi:hypothetical protein
MKSFLKWILLWLQSLLELITDLYFDELFVLLYVLIDHQLTGLIIGTYRASSDAIGLIHDESSFVLLSIQQIATTMPVIFRLVTALNLMINT